MVEIMHVALIVYGVCFIVFGGYLVRLILYHVDFSKRYNNLLSSMCLRARAFSKRMPLNSGILIVNTQIVTRVSNGSIIRESSQAVTGLVESEIDNTNEKTPWN